MTDKADELELRLFKLTFYEPWFDYSRGMGDEYCKAEYKGIYVACTGAEAVEKFKQSDWWKAYTASTGGDAEKKFEEFFEIKRMKMRFRVGFPALCEEDSKKFSINALLSPGGGGYNGYTVEYRILEKNKE